VRTAAFAFLREQSALHGDTLPRTLLARGFVFEGQRVPLLGPQGIFKPAILPELPLSITTARSSKARTGRMTTTLAPTDSSCIATEERTRSIATTWPCDWPDSGVCP